MTHYTTLASNIKRKLIKFSETICQGLSRPDFKFVTQMLYGLLASGSCQLSEISRSLNEDIALKKTIERLSRHLATFSGQDKLISNYIEKVKTNLAKTPILLIDGSDITKPHSPHMEYISKVRDGSTGEIANGYHTLGITALSATEKMPIPIYHKIYSSVEPGFISEDTEVLTGLNFLSKHFHKKSVRAFDRGYDANIYFERLIDADESFVTRIKKNRTLIYKGKKINSLELAGRFKGKYLLKFRKKNGFEVDVKVTSIPVQLPCRADTQLHLVIVKGFGKTPLMLLTNIHVKDDRLPIVISKVYLLRWRIEEYYRFKKQQFNYEDFRVRGIQSIRNLDLLVTIATGHIAIMADKPQRITTYALMDISKRIFDFPKFSLYALTDGLTTLFSRISMNFSNHLRKRRKSLQLTLDIWGGFDCVGIE